MVSVESRSEPRPKAQTLSNEKSIEVKTLRNQIWRFGLVGLVGFAVNAGIVEASACRLGPVWAQVLAFPVAVTVTWGLNRRYTFNVSGYAWNVEWMRYIVANAIGWIVINGIYFVLILNYFIFNQNPSLALILGAIGGFLLNFMFSRVFVFGEGDEK